MILKEIIEIFYRFLKVSTLIEYIFRNFYQTTLFISYDCSTSRNIVNQWNLSERISWIVIYAFFFTLIFLIFGLDIVDSFKHNVKILSFITFFENYLIHIVSFKLKIHG